MAEVEWWYTDGSNRVGPVSLDALRQLLRESKISQSTLIWAEGFSNWAPISNVPGLASVDAVGTPEVHHSFSKFCMHCGSKHQRGAHFCPRCGKTIAPSISKIGADKDESDQREPVFSGANPLAESPAQGSTAFNSSQSWTRTNYQNGHSPNPLNDREAWEAYIGEKNQDYYVSRFETQAKGESVRWHWPSFFITWYWLLYRKLWPQSVLYFFLPYVALIPIAALMGAYEAYLEGIMLAVWIGFFLLPPMFANGLYWRRALKTMNRLRGISRTREQYLRALGAAGGTSGVAMVIASIFGIISLVGILAAVALPAYEDYTKKVQIAQVTNHGEAAARRVAEVYKQTQTIAERVDELGLPPKPTAVTNIRISQENGTLYYVMRGVGTVEFQPTIEDDGKVGVICRSTDVRQSWLPARCRNE